MAYGRDTDETRDSDELDPLKVEFKTILELPCQDGLSIEEGGGVRLDHFEFAEMVRISVCSSDQQDQDREVVYVDSLTMDEIVKAWLLRRIDTAGELRNREQLVVPSVEQDIETARQSFAALLLVEESMTAAAAQMRDPLRWLEAISTLGTARGLLQRFIGERLTGDIMQAHQARRDNRDAGDDQVTP